MRENKKDYSRNSKQNSHFEKILPEDYINTINMNGYYDDEEKNHLNIKYSIDYPRKICECFGGNNGRQDSMSQIRKYYEYVLRLLDIMRLNGSYSTIEYDLQQLIKHTEYTCNKSNPPISKVFVEFIKCNVNAIKDEKDLVAFKKHFESVVAFSKSK